MRHKKKNKISHTVKEWIAFVFSREYNRSMRWAETYFRKHMPMKKDANALG